MAHSKDLYNRANAHYRLGELRTSERYFAMAAQAALDEQDQAQRHEALVWQGECLCQLSQIRVCMRVLLDARLLEAQYPEAPANEFECWMLRKELYQLRLVTGLALHEIKSSLSEVLEYAQQHAVPAHDVDVIKADLADVRGEWSEALTHYENAKANWDGRAGGYLQSYLAFSTFNAALKIGRFDAAQDWTAAIDNDSDREGGYGDLIDMCQTLARYTLARAKGAEYAQLRNLHLDIEGASPLMDISAGDRAKAQFWLGLLNPQGGDPAERAHVARRALARTPILIENKLSLYAGAQLVLDYRIACVRHVAGLPPHDDEWHPAPLPTKVSVSIAQRSEFDRRLVWAMRIGRSVLRRAQALDAALECHWRTAEVQRRLDWLQSVRAIAG